MLRIFAVTLSALAIAGSPLLAQTTAPDPAADLTIIYGKASGNQYVRSMLEQIVARENGQSRGLEQLTRVMGSSFGTGGNFTPPLAYRDAVNFQKSQMRAQIIGQIMVADLNNDGDVARAELKAKLQFDQNNVAAAAFFASDADDDGILSAAEIRDSAALTLRRNGGNSDQGPEYLVAAFDFDDDGVLTEEEFNRVKAALGL